MEPSGASWIVIAVIGAVVGILAGASMYFKTHNIAVAFLTFFVVGASLVGLTFTGVFIRAILGDDDDLTD